MNFFGSIFYNMHMAILCPMCSYVATDMYTLIAQVFTQNQE